jgi:hypothetical protein
MVYAYVPKFNTAPQRVVAAPLRSWVSYSSIRLDDPQRDKVVFKKHTSCHLSGVHLVTPLWWSRNYECMNIIFSPCIWTFSRLLLLNYTMNNCFLMHKWTRIYFHLITLKFIRKHIRKRTNINNHFNMYKSI